jgi:hypothetical protein
VLCLSAPPQSIGTSSPVFMELYINAIPMEGTATPEFFLSSCSWLWGTRWLSLLRHRPTSQKVMGSIPHGVIGSFHSHNPSHCTVALRLTQPLTEMSTRNISWGGEGGWCMGLTTLPPYCADCLEIWEPQPPGILRTCPGL